MGLKQRDDPLAELGNGNTAKVSSAVPVEVCAGCLAGSVCAAGEVMLSCPSAGAGATSPGQSANFTCVTAP